MLEIKLVYNDDKEVIEEVSNYKELEELIAHETSNNLKDWKIIGRNLK